MDEYAFLDGLYNAGKLAYNKALDYKFMDALFRASGLIHVVDVSGSLDSEGRDSEITTIYKENVIFPFDWISTNIVKVIGIQE